MKILYLSSFYPPYTVGGAEITLSTLVQGMRARGHEVVVLCTGPQSGWTEEEVNGVRVVRVGIKNFYWNFVPHGRSGWLRSLWHLRDIYNLQMANMLQAFIEKERPDLVSCHILAGWSASAWGVLKRAGLPVVQVLHDMYLICARSSMYHHGTRCITQCGRCAIFRALHPLMTSNVDCVVGISQFVLDRHIALGYFHKTPIHQVIHNTRSISPRTPVRKQNEGGFIRFGFIGTLSPEKGVEWLLEVFSKLATTWNVELWVAGTGAAAYGELLQARYASSRISFLGRVSPEEFYPEIDVLIVPSLWDEPLGMVVPEAFIYGVPVLASRRGGLPEMIVCGRNGYLFDVDDSRDIVGLIYKFVQDPSLILRMQPMVQASAAPYLDTDGWCRKYESIYLDLI